MCEIRMPNNVQNTTCISRATSGRLPSNDEDTLLVENTSGYLFTILQQFSAILFTTSTVRVLSFAENALERSSSPHLRPPFFSFVSRQAFRCRFEILTTNVSNRFSFASRLVVCSSMKGALFALLSRLKLVIQVTPRSSGEADEIQDEREPVFLTSDDDVVVEYRGLTLSLLNTAPC